MSFLSKDQMLKEQLKEDFEIDGQIEVAKRGAKIHYYPKGFGRLTIPVEGVEKLAEAGVLKEKHRIKMKVIINPRQREALDNLGRFDLFPYVVIWVMPEEGEARK